MKREPVDSEAMRSVGYDRRRHILEVEFERGSVYRYLGVPAAVHDALRDAASLGAYFSEHIRDAGYLVERVDEALSAADLDRSAGASAGTVGSDAHAGGRSRPGHHPAADIANRLSRDLSN